MPLFDVEALRREFDAAFARPVRDAGENTEDVVAIRVAGSPYALRVAELAGVSAGHRVTPVPSAHATLLGLVGIRGALVPVFDLARLLGEQAVGETPRWIAVSRGEQPIGLAFAAVEGQLPVAASAFAVAEGERELVEHVVRGATGLRAVVSVVRVVSWLRGQSGLEAPHEGKVERA